MTRLSHRVITKTTYNKKANPRNKGKTLTLKGLVVEPAKRTTASPTEIEALP